MPPNRAVREGRSAGGIYISHKGVYCLLVLDRLKVSKFQEAKTSANKRFYNMSAKSIAQLCAAKLQQNLRICKFLVEKVYS